jgi:homeobox-leucine zipper protein
MVTAKEAAAMDASKYVRYTPEQVEALERLYYECPKPSSLRRHQLVRDCSVLANVDPKQIKVWFQNRRCGAVIKDFNLSLRTCANRSDRFGS